MLRLFAGLVAIAIVAPAPARDALDFTTMKSGDYRSSVDLSAYAPSADAKPPSHRFEGRLQLSGKPSLRTLVADKDYLTDEGIETSKTWIDDFDYAFVQHG